MIITHHFGPSEWISKTSGRFQILFESLDYGWWWKLSNGSRLTVTTGSVSLKSKVKPPTQPPHPHPSQGTPYQHSGSTGGPIRLPKQQYIPPKQSIFPERPRSWVTTGSVGLKSKVKPPNNHPIPILYQGPHINTLGPRGAPSDPPNNNTYPQNDPFFLSALDRG